MDWTAILILAILSAFSLALIRQSRELSERTKSRSEKLFKLGRVRDWQTVQLDFGRYRMVEIVKGLSEDEVWVYEDLPVEENGRPKWDWSISASQEGFLVLPNPGLKVLGKLCEAHGTKFQNFTVHKVNRQAW